jgi:hypothetical protein
MLAEIYLNSPLFLKTVMVFGTFIAPVACVAVWCRPWRRGPEE